MFNEKKYVKTYFYIDVLSLNMMYVGRKRLFDDDIQTIAAEAPQLAEPPPGKTSSRNIKSFPRKKRRGKRPTPGLGSNRLSPSTPTPEPVIRSPSASELIHQYKTTPKLIYQFEITHKQKTKQHMPSDNVLNIEHILQKIKTPSPSALESIHQSETTPEH